MALQARAKPLIGLAVIAALGLAAAAPAENHPPAAPTGETPLADPPTPPAACIKTVMDVVTREGGRLERTLTTRSARFGDVWRADFSTPGYDGALVSRAICWADQTLIIMRQRIPILPVAGHNRRGAAVHCQYTAIDNPCRADPVAMVWLCLRPGLMLYADGHTEPGEPAGVDVRFVNRAAAESDAAWTTRCAPRGGIYRAEN